MFTFTLSKLAPGDPVLLYMNLGGERRIVKDLDKETYDALYLATAEKHHLGLPVFYISLTPWCLSPDLSQGMNYIQTKHAESFVRKYGHTSKVLAYLNSREAFFENQYTQSNLTIAERSLLVNLDTSRLQVHIDRAMDRLSQSFHVDEASFQQMKENWQTLKDHDPAWYAFLPKPQWHGVQNQYHKWMANILTGRWGVSSMDGRPVLDKIWQALQWSLPFNILSWIGIIGLSVWIGVFTALHSNKFWVKLIENTLLIINATPLFWLSSIAVIYLTGSQVWQIFPSPGSIDHLYTQGSFSQLMATFFFILLPLICIVLSSLAVLSRQIKQLLVQELNKPYIQAAVLRGLPQKKILWVYALPNALIPLTAYIGRIIPALISGAVVIESIFNIPGIGKLIVSATLARDWNVAFLVFLLGASLTIFGVILSDYLLARLAPLSLQSLIRSK